MSIESYREKKRIEFAQLQALKVPELSGYVDRETAITDYNIMMGTLLDPQEVENDAQQEL